MSDWCPVSLRDAILSVAIAGVWCVTALAGEYRFEESDVLDVSTDQQLAPREKGDTVATTTLAADIAKAIVAAPEVGNEARGQLQMLEGTDKVERKREQARIQPDSTSV